MEDEQPQEKPAPRHRPPWLLLAWLTPVLSPLAFALAVWIGLVRFLEGLLQGVPALNQATDLTGLFFMGWLCGTALCGGFAAWIAVKAICERPFTRIIAFCLLWPLCAGLQGTIGAAVGMPACAAVGTMGH